MKESITAKESDNGIAIGDSLTAGPAVDLYFERFGRSTTGGETPIRCEIVNGIVVPIVL